MKELIEPVIGFELTTKTLIKHFKDIPIKILYEVVDNSFDGRFYQDLVLYIPSGNNKDIGKISQARSEVINEITNYPGSFMEDFSEYEIYSKEFELRTVFCIRKYNDDTKIY